MVPSSELIVAFESILLTSILIYFLLFLGWDGEGSINPRVCLGDWRGDFGKKKKEEVKGIEDILKGGFWSFIFFFFVIQNPHKIVKELKMCI